MAGHRPPLIGRTLGAQDGRFLFTAWSVLWGIFMFAAMIPATNAATVLLTYGWSGYSPGVRVAWIKPPQFTNGERLPAAKAQLALGVTFVSFVAVGLAPSFILPRRFLPTWLPSAQPPDNQPMHRTGPAVYCCGSIGRRRPAGDRPYVMRRKLSTRSRRLNILLALCLLFTLLNAVGLVAGHLFLAELASAPVSEW